MELYQRSQAKVFFPRHTWRVSQHTYHTLKMKAHTHTLPIAFHLRPNHWRGPVNWKPLTCCTALHVPMFPWCSEATLISPMGVIVGPSLPLLFPKQNCSFSVPCFGTPTSFSWGNRKNKITEREMSRTSWMCDDDETLGCFAISIQLFYDVRLKMVLLQLIPRVPLPKDTCEKFS